jgi:hypothetical protein
MMRKIDDRQDVDVVKGDVKGIIRDADVSFDFELKK